MQLRRFLNALSPTQTAFLGSLLLSLTALLTSPIINRDGLLYVETARIFLQSDLATAFSTFDWPFLSVLMAIFSKLTGIVPENSGHILNVFFMAGACALTVNCAERRMPEAAWATCLVILALPGFNNYRDELIREYGCWFFTVLSFWLALRWSESPRWKSGLLIQAALCAAVLFRLEALAFFAAMVLWQFCSAPAGERIRRLLMISSIPFACIFASMCLILAKRLAPTGRLNIFADFFDLARKRELFDIKVQALSAALIPYARNQAETILFMGSLAIIPLKFIRQLELFLIPALFLFRGYPLRQTLSRLPLFAWAFLAHVVVLSFFVIDMQFLAGRYVAVLGLLAAPFIGCGLKKLMDWFPKWNVLILSLCFLTMGDNVISWSRGQTHLLDAGKWLAANVPANSRIYIDSNRTAYYAGWKLNRVSAYEIREEATEEMWRGDFDWVIVEIPDDNAWLDSWLDRTNLQLHKRFSNAKKDSVIVATPKRLP